MLRLNRRSLQRCLRAFDRVSTSARAASKAASREGGTVLFDTVRENMSLTDHSLRDLAAMDHPYASRHSSITIHRSGGRGLQTPEFRIHTQDGKLLRALKKTTRVQDEGRHVFRIFVDESVAKHARYVFEGTKIMHGRNLIPDVAGSPDTQANIRSAVITTLRGRLAKVGVRVK